jgi:hypothetical protein
MFVIWKAGRVQLVVENSGGSVVRGGSHWSVVDESGDW